MSSIVPWTNPGGVRCCCADCTSALLSGLTTKYARIDLTSEEYASIRNGAELEYSVTIIPSGLLPNGRPILSYIGTTLIPTISFPFFNGTRLCYGVGSENSAGTIGVNSAFPSAFFITADNNVTYTFGFSYNYTLVLQDAGQGAPADAPLSTPAMYLYGIAGQLVRNLPTHSVVFEFDDTGTSGGLAFGDSGRPIKTSKTTTGLIDGTIQLSLGFAAP